MGQLWTSRGEILLRLCHRNLVLLAVLAFFCPHVAQAQCAGVCRSDEVVVGEDRTHCFCKNRVEYAACIRRTGQQWRGDHAGCARQAEQCFRSKGYQLTAAALAGLGCVGNCAAVESVPMFIRSCVTTCSTAAAITASVLETCAADLNNTCQATALAQLRKSQADCRN